MTGDEKKVLRSTNINLCGTGNSIIKAVCSLMKKYVVMSVVDDKILNAWMYITIRSTIKDIYAYFWLVFYNC